MTISYNTTKVAGDTVLSADWNTFVAALENTSSGHLHNGTDSRLVASSVITFDPSGLSIISGTEVQTALEELDAAITSEDIWDRTGTTISYNTSGDTLSIDGPFTTSSTVALTANSATITHSGTTSLTISSTSGTVIIEGLTISTTVLTGATSITSTAFVGALTGNASSATILETARTIGGVSFNGSANIVPTTIVVADTTSATCYVGLWESATGDLLPKTDLGITYNASTGALTATGFSGPLTGNADSATLASTVTVADESVDTECFVSYFTAASGSLAVKTGTNLTFNSNTGLLTATLFGDGTFSTSAGAFSGVVSITDGTASWSSNSLSGFTSISGATLTDTVMSINSGSLTSVVNITMSGLLTITSSNAGLIDLNPSAQGTQNVIDITPSTNVTPAATWKGLHIDGQNLDPATGTACIIYPVHVDFTGFNSVTGNSSACMFRGEPGAGDSMNVFHAIMTELTADKVQTHTRSSGGSLALSATGTYRGLWVDWDSVTRNGGSPVLEGVRIELPADYTNFGTSFAAYFGGDGRSVTICDTSYALNISGAVNFDNAITGVTTLGMTGALSGGTTIACSGNITTSGGYIEATNGALRTGDADTAGTVVLSDGSSHTITIDTPSISTSYNLTLPTTDGGANQLLKTDGSGNLSYSTVTEISGALAAVTTIAASNTLTITCLDASNVVCADFIQQDTGGVSAVKITNASTNSSLYVDQNGSTAFNLSSGAVVIENTGNPGAALAVYTDIGATAAYPLMTITLNNVAHDATALFITGNGIGSATQGIVHIAQSGVLVANAYALYVTATGINNQATSGVACFVQEHASSIAPVLALRNDGDCGATLGTLYINDTNANNDNTIYTDSTAKLVHSTGVWTDKVSWRELKTDIEEAPYNEILDNLSKLSIYTYHYKDTKKIINKPIEHLKLIGPMMDDTDEYLTPGKYEDGASISAKNGYGYALAAIKGLINQNKILIERIEKLEGGIAQ